MADLKIDLNVNTEALERDLVEYERLGGIFPTAIDWLVDPDRFSALVEIKTVQPSDGKLYLEMQPSEFLLGFISALHMAEKDR